jgi:hypothetical protein
MFISMLRLVAKATPLVASTRRGVGGCGEQRPRSMLELRDIVIQHHGTEMSGAGAQ